jgi:ABC-2 type transport system ATP-binding protein
MAAIALRGLTKRFGPIHAVQELTVDIGAGQVTGFLGPNGAGKTTTLRMLLGLVQPTAGEALIGGRRYADLRQPRRVTGAVLEATGFHPGRHGRDHLAILARLTGVGRTRVDEVLDQVGLQDAAHRRVGSYSLGMRQRLGLAAALLGDPAVLLLDEPANGLDPEGIAWLRRLLRHLAADGRTVVISSHLLSEVAQTVDQVVIISGGRLRFAGPLADLGSGAVTVRTAQVEQLRDLLGHRGCAVRVTGESTLAVRGATAAEVGRLAADAHIALTTLTDSAVSLEAAFLQLTSTPAAPQGVVNIPEGDRP